MFTITVSDEFYSMNSAFFLHIERYDFVCVSYSFGVVLWIDTELLLLK